MKTNYTVFKIVAVALLFTCNSWGQGTIAQWNFNGPLDNVPGGASSPIVSNGIGTAQLIGGTTATFASGNTTAGTLDLETTTPPNYGWNTTGYPAAGTGSKTAGVQFNVSTVGQAGIIFKFEQRHSNTSSNTYVAQYTTDRTAGTPIWVDAQIFTFTPAATGTGDTWYNARTADMSAITALDNNPNVAFRVVSAFDPIAGDYVASKLGSTYGGGTGRFDMVTITSNVTLAVSQFEATNNNLKVYPNPSNKEVVTLSQTQDITVSDVSGKVIYVAKNASSIDTKSFKTGVYFIKTASGATTKLLVN